MFLGYPTGTKGYKLYDLQRKHIFVSRNVVFHESVFQFHSDSNQPGEVENFPDLVLPTSQADMTIVEPLISAPIEDHLDLPNHSVDTA